ncbi:MAG: DUF551 domain-containing protein [Betaproteobacteria bacterium]|nr:DUF551 domain-containing protein [Betaproteobacteria bacterium]
MTTMGERLRDERKRAGWTQDNLARATHITRRTQVAYETGRRTPRGEYLLAVSEQGLDVQFIISGRVPTIWIPVTERLPDLLQDVLIVWRDSDGFANRDMGYLQRNGRWYLVDSYDDPVEVTHWAPFPALPAGLQEAA